MNNWDSVHQILLCSSSISTDLHAFRTLGCLEPLAGSGRPNRVRKSRSRESGSPEIREMKVFLRFFSRIIQVLKGDIRETSPGG